MRRALLIATAVQAIAHALWLAYAHFLAQGGDTLSTLLFAVVPLAAYCAASLVPRRKVFIGTFVALPAALLFAASNFAYSQLGHAVDFSGSEGALLVFSISAPVCALLAAAGAGLACLSPYRPV
jgi:hypothetical protein